MKLTKQNNNIIIQFDFDRDIIKAVKAIPGRKFDFKNKLWICSVGVAPQLLEALKPFDFVIDPAITNLVKTQKQTETDLEKIKSQDDVNIKFKTPLFPYQKVGVAFMLKAGHCLLGDEPGLGKTLQFITVCQARKTKKNLVICPAILKENWSNEVKKWHPEATPIIVEGSKENRYKIYTNTKKKTGIWYLIVGYETMRNDIDKINEI